MAELAVSARDLWRALLTQHARERGAAPAISHRSPDGRYDTVCYRELLELVRDYARLFEATTSPGQVIPLCLARGAECSAAMLGALVSGRAFCCVNPKLRLPQLEQILARLGSAIALVDGQGLAALRGEWEPESPVRSLTWYMVGGARTRASARLLGELARETAVVHDFRASSRRGSAFAPADTASYARGASVHPVSTALQVAQNARALGLAPGRHSDGPAVGAGQAPALPAKPLAAQVGCCLFTSGSTGAPKGVLISPEDLWQRARTELAWFGLSSSDVLLNLLPFSFDVGLNQLLSSVMAGAELVVLDSWLPADVLAAAAARGVTGIASVPTIWADFIASRRAFDPTLGHRRLRFLTISGGDLSVAQHARMPELAPGVQIFKTYGQTEAFRISSLKPEEYAERPWSVGRALPGGHLYVARADGTEAEPGELGEIVHTGTGTMLGYLGDDERAKLRPNPWRGPDDPNPLAVFTGDLGQLDQAGYLRLVGRRDDLVKISGNRVYPSEVKSLLTSLPGVASAEVVALRCEERTRLAAFVIPRAGVALERERLRRELQERAPSYMVPELLVLRSELPRTASGKPDRTHLVEQAFELLKRGLVAAVPLLATILPMGS